MKRRILASVQKLSDRDCADAAVDELRDAAEQLDGEQFALLLHTLTEGLGNPHYAKMAFTRRLIIQVVGELGAEYMDRLNRRHVAKLCSTIFKHVSDSDGNVREACADAFAFLAESYSVAIPSTTSKADSRSPTSSSRLSLFLQCVFDSLSSKAQGKVAQQGAGLCLARMIARVGPVHVTPSLPRLCQRLEAQLNSKACAAKTVRPCMPLARRRLRLRLSSPDPAAGATAGACEHCRGQQGGPVPPRAVHRRAPLPALQIIRNEDGGG